MPVLPIPMIIALVLFGLLVHRLVTRETHATLLALIAICAVQSAISALVHYYGLMAIRPLQPVLATVIPPVAWLAFSWAAGGDTRSSHLAWHVIGPVLGVTFLLTHPTLLDVLIPLSFAGYGAAMLLQLRRGEDSLPHSRLESGATSLLAWRIIAVSLIVSAASDVLIAYSLASGRIGFLMWVPSVMSSLTLLGLGALGLSHAIESRRENMPDESPISPEDLDRDRSIVSKLAAYVQEQKPYLDPDLTLARLSRRLLVPAKQLSAAINRVTDENVSRYMNRFRIEHAASLITQGKSVTDAMLSSGFNTKSNFNREFLRVKGVSPSKWLEEREKTL
ncbi:MAG: helix-turn-helix domain-containing protein [Aestuariivirga sp.]